MNNKSLYTLAGLELRSMRKNRGLSIFRVGRDIGVSGNYISQIERGERPASDATLISLASVYDVDSDELFNLYKRIPAKLDALVLNTPHLIKTLSDITSDPRLSSDDLELIYKELNEIALKYLPAEDC